MRKSTVCNACARFELMRRVHRRPADTKDVLSIINEVSLSVTKHINRHAPLRVAVAIFIMVYRERERTRGIFTRRCFPMPLLVLHLPFKRVRIPIVRPDAIRDNIFEILTIHAIFRDVIPQHNLIFRVLIGGYLV